MAENFNIKLNLAALEHRVQKMKGAKGEVEVLVIPFKENHIFRGEKGLYIEATAFALKEPKERNGKTDTHLVKVSLPKEVYQAMTEEQRKSQPIFGNMSQWGGVSESNEAAAKDMNANDDLPWS